MNVILLNRITLKNKIGCLLALLVSIAAMAQPPAPNGNAKKVAIVGGTYHIGNGSTVIENGYLVLDKGKIVSIGKLPFSSSDTIGAKLIQANGRHIYPGFTLLNTSIGLIEVGAVRATQDKYEAGSVNSNARSIIAYNAESELIYTARYNGILSAQIVPRGGLVSGQFSLVGQASTVQVKILNKGMFLRNL
jgi:imidazolonepropionase-like amidohydrolase